MLIINLICHSKACSPFSRVSNTCHNSAPSASDPSHPRDRIAYRFTGNCGPGDCVNVNTFEIKRFGAFVQRAAESKKCKQNPNDGSIKTSIPVTGKF
ncbi:hypothetical protein EVAR_31565_1 [Eumeta japonica]|uniref:Uncharacterized protein n=1 Tax=Eumeta variegata TaxID=151549 RepID=A0A4C1V896_EUMVA|nr:hypothetical protein EVAR_31565_1 [Eumeta japonica]